MLTYSLNQNNWQQIGNLNLVASQSPEGAHIPIVPQTLSVQSEARLVAIFVGCNDARMTWNYGGMVLQRITTGLTIGGLNDSTYRSKRLYLGEINLFEVTLPVSSYSLKFIIPRYFPSWQCAVWEYTGEVNDSLETKLDEIQADLTTLINP